LVLVKTNSKPINYHPYSLIFVGVDKKLVRLKPKITMKIAILDFIPPL
jgi:hypothetical protein